MNERCPHCGLVFEAERVRVAMVHDAGPSVGRAGRLRRRFPDALVVVFGHSHVPLVLREEGLLLVDPGSPTWKRRRPAPTYATLSLAGGRARARVVALR